VVVDVETNSAAAQAGVVPGDVLVEVNGRRIKRTVDFYNQSALLMVGDTVAVKVLRDGKSRQLQLAIAADSFEQMSGAQLDQRLTGVELQNFRSDDDPSTGAGVLVTDLAPDSVAWERGLRPGDIIVAVNRMPTRNLAELGEIVRAGGPAQLLLRAYRAGEFGYIVIP